MWSTSRTINVRIGVGMIVEGQFMSRFLHGDNPSCRRGTDDVVDIQDHQF